MKISRFRCRSAANGVSAGKRPADETKDVFADEKGKLCLTFNA